MFFLNVFMITKTEIYNTVEKLTDSFEINKLKILLDDFEYYFFIEKDKKLAECTNEEIWDAIQKLKDKGKPIPYLPNNVFEKDENGKTKLVRKGNSDRVNIEKLLYPYEFYGCYQFQGLLKDFINEQESKILQAKNKQTISNKIVGSNLDNPKTKLVEFKDKLDFSLGYYSDLFAVINAIQLQDENLLISAITLLKTKSFGVMCNENLLTEQVHFYLNTNEASIYYKYGLLKINQILSTFNMVSSRINSLFADENLNKKIHDIWHQYSDLGDVFVLYSNSHEGFIKSLHSNIEKNITQFKAIFTSSISLNSEIKIAPQFSNSSTNTGSQNTENSSPIAKTIQNQDISNPQSPPVHYPTQTVNKNIQDEDGASRIKDAIDDFMEDFKTAIPAANEFDKACITLQDFFQNKLWSISKPVFVKKGNKVRLAYILGSLYKDLKPDAISYEYLSLLIQLFSIFKDEKIDGKPLISTNLYKYCTSKN